MSEKCTIIGYVNLQLEDIRREVGLELADVIAEAQKKTYEATGKIVDPSRILRRCNYENHK